MALTIAPVTVLHPDATREAALDRLAAYFGTDVTPAQFRSTGIPWFIALGGYMESRSLSPLETAQASLP